MQVFQGVGRYIVDVVKSDVKIFKVGEVIESIGGQ